MDGLLARDLQLRPSSKFAYLLRPLPTRAAQLDTYAQLYRRRILRVVSVSKAAKRYVCLHVIRLRCAHLDECLFAWPKDCTTYAIP